MQSSTETGKRCRYNFLRAAVTHAAPYGYYQTLAAERPLSMWCYGIGAQEGLRFEAAQFGLCFATHDMREGTRAFLEKRGPTWIVGR